MSNQELRKKISSKADIKPAPLEDTDLFGGGLKVPTFIQKELDAKKLVARFVSLTTLNKTGGHHPRGWTPYVIDSPEVNPVTGNAEKTFKYGDLILAVKTKEGHSKHVAALAQRSKSQSSAHKNSVREMRDRIRDGRADKHISLIEGYEENGDDE